MHALVDVTSEDWTRLVSANLTAPFFMMQAAISHLIARNDNVVNVISAAAFIGQAYAATKAGLLSLTKSQAMENMHSTIRINALAPGGMLTPMADRKSGVKGKRVSVRVDLGGRRLIK